MARRDVRRRGRRGRECRTTALRGCARPSVLLLAAVLTGCATESAKVDTGELDEVRAELIAMADEDRASRSADVDAMSGEERAAFFEAAREGDIARAARLEDIVDQHGWPTAAMVGEDAAHAAFLIVQHADHDPAFQARCLALLERAAAEGEIEGRHVAFLTDRVRVKQGLAQVYGTQYGVEMLDGGGFRYLAPIVVDPAGLDERREAVGLEAWVEYDRRMAEMQGREPFDGPRGED